MYPRTIDPNFCDYIVARTNGNMTDFAQCSHKWKHEYRETSDGPLLRRCNLHHSSSIEARRKASAERFEQRPELAQLRLIQSLQQLLATAEREKRELEAELDGLRATLQYALCANCHHQPHYDKCAQQLMLTMGPVACDCNYPQAQRDKQEAELAKPVEHILPRACPVDGSLLNDVRQASADGVLTFQSCMRHQHRYNEHFEPRMCATCHTNSVTNQYSTECEACRLESRASNESQATAVTVEPMPTERYPGRIAVISPGLSDKLDKLACPECTPEHDCYLHF